MGKKKTTYTFTALTVTFDIFKTSSQPRQKTKSPLPNFVDYTLVCFLIVFLLNFQTNFIITSIKCWAKQ